MKTEESDVEGTRRSMRRHEDQDKDYEDTFKEEKSEKRIFKKNAKGKIKVSSIS